MRKLPYIILKKWRSWQRNRVRRWLYKRLPIEDLPYFHSYLDNEDAMEDRFELLLSEIDSLQIKWKKLNQDTSKQLSYLLHLSKIYESFERDFGENIGDCKDLYDNISPVAREIYIDVNCIYKTMHKCILDAIIARIKIEVDTDDEAQEIIDKVRKVFAQQFECKVWVPLMRFGTKFACAEGKKSNEVIAYSLYYGFAYHIPWAPWDNGVRKQGYKVSFGEIPPPSKYNNYGSHGRLVPAYLVDTWVFKDLIHLKQEFLLLFSEKPATYLEKCKNLSRLPGYCPDARKSFVCYSFHLALQIAILEYKWKSELLFQRMVHEKSEVIDDKLSERDNEFLHSSYSKLNAQSTSKYNTREFGIYVVLAAFRLNSILGLEAAKWSLQKGILRILYFSALIALFGACMIALMKQ